MDFQSYFPLVIVAAHKLDQVDGNDNVRKSLQQERALGRGGDMLSS